MANCPIPDAECLNSFGDGERYAHTECADCGRKFECEGDVGCRTLPNVDGYHYPICHPQGCGDQLTDQKCIDWDAKYRHTLTLSVSC